MNTIQSDKMSELPFQMPIDLEGVGRDRLCQLIFSTSIDGILIAGLHGEIQHANIAAVGLLGYEMQTLVGMNLKDLTEPKWSELDQHIERVLNENGGLGIAMKRQFRTGTRQLRTIQCRSWVLRNHQGQPRYIVHMLHDQTSYEHVRDYASTIEKRLRKLLDSSNDVLSMQDLDGRYLFFSGPRHAPVADHVAVGCKPQELFPRPAADHLFEEFEKVKRTGEDSHREIYINMQGFEAWFSRHTYPIFNSNGELVAVGAIAHNITDAKRATLKLHEREQMLNSILGTSPSIMFIFDMKQWQMIYVNERIQETLGYCPETFLGFDRQQHDALFHPDDFAGMKAFQSNLHWLRDGQIMTHRSRARHAGGHWLWIEYRVTPFKRDGSGQLEQIIGSAHDVSDRMRIDQRRQRLMRELDHRLQNTLTSLRAMSDRLARNHVDVNRYHLALSNCIQAMAAAHHELSSQGWQAIQCNALVRAVLRPFLLDHERAHRLKFHCGGIALPPRLTQPIALIFNELATNATRHGAWAADQGTVHIHCAVEEDQWVLQWIEDHDRTIRLPICIGDGLMLIQQLVEYEMRGRFELDLTPKGLHCSLRLKHPIEFSSI